ncbi:hypothetical protein GCM10008957_34970 [Deinococcus ruber]|uniref:Xylose isomerase n=1 Tax=Deinococcus ruber TaxID=1848197 RepID=A0A918F8M7_9DEIO|nr:hypothetical protein GCM10008957_34970 [Deinococcus ruber]
MEQAAEQFRQQGYAGLENHFGDAQTRRHARSVLAATGMLNVAMVFTQPHPVAGHTVQAHLDSLAQGLAEALDTEPVCVNVHAGYDAWDEADTLRFFEGASRLGARLSIPVGFETHRGRSLNTPWRTLMVLDHFPDVRLTLDLSHWVLVCERLPDDQQTALQAAAQACVHLHARVGSEQAPQLNDPRAPEHARLVAWFEAQWRRVWQAQQARGDAVSTLTPEFGPPDYQPTLPYTGAVISDLADVCNWMRDRLADRFARAGASAAADIYTVG